MRRGFLGWVRENPDINKFTKIVLHVIFLSAPIFIIGLFAWFTFFGSDGKKTFLTNHSLESFNGKVDSLYFDKQNHNIKIALLSNKYAFEMFPSWEQKIEVGDSIAKMGGSLKITIFKRDGTQIILDYEKEVKDWK